MRQGPFYVLLAALTLASAAHAEEQVSPAMPQTDESAAQILSLQQQLAESERQRQALQADSEAGERDNAQLSRLRQDNQRLKLQLKQAQAQEPQRLLSEQQLWFAIGAGTALLAFVVGRLSAGGRNKRRSEWI